ncbi:hypothetical protein WA026_017791 [Henosepilachna vigintioctopunctata]|uniref:C2H2-type domain-containing protein n=1 Tax=Henosepilachna vigintioctopunctata TaxID=420089 RepID=A0AAW1U961_9CUCU
MSIHNTQKPYECFYCRKKFKNILMCGRHIKTHENNDAKQDIPKSSLSYVEDESSVANISVNVSDSMTLLEVNPDEILDNLFDSESKKITEDSSNLAVTENLEKFATSSTTPLELEKSTELQTFFVECSTGVHDEGVLSNNFFPHLDLQPSNIIDIEPVNEMQDSPMIFNVQNLIGEGTFPAVDMMNGELYMNNSSVHTGSQETKTLFTNVQKIMSSALNNSIGMPNDISDNFLANNISLYPNTHISFEKSEEISPAITSNLSSSQEATCLDDTENLETNSGADSNIITVSFEESGGTTGNLNIIHCSECKGLFDNMTTYDSHTCLKPVLKNNSFDEFVDLDKNVNTSAKFLDNKNLLKNKNKSQKPVKKNFSCVYCGREFHSRGAYIRHANTHQKNDDGLHKCKFCIKKFKKPSDLSRHLRTHTGEKPYACDKCDKKFSLKSTLEGHYRTHNPGATKDFLCEVCNSFFTSKSSLKLHMHVHTGVKPHKCNYCDLHFRTLAHRRSHEQKIHSNGTKNMQNKLDISVDHSKLESIIEKSQNLEMQEIPEPTHMKMHSSEEGSQNLSDAIQIDEVLLEQLQSSNIIIEVLHDIDPKEQSSVISLDENTLENLGLLTATNKQFNELPMIDADDRTQIESERNLECEICHKKYASKDVFRKHMQLHSKNKFICDLCNKWFSTVEALCEHEKLHSGHRPYPCFLCTNNFAELQHLKSHLRRIHQIEDTSQLILKV